MIQAICSIVFMSGLSVAPVQATGDSTAVLTQGSRVRIRLLASPQHRLVGSLDRLTSDTLLVSPWGAKEPQAIRVAEVSSLEVSQGRHSNLLRGMGIGLLGGAAVGAIVGLVSYDEDNCFPICGAGNNAAVGAIVFGGLGLITGTVVGGASHREKWRTIPIVDNKVGFAPLLRRGMALRFYSHF